VSPVDIPLKVGVVGTGSMGRNHLRLLSAMPQYELMGCYDANALVSAGYASQYAITAYESVDQLLDEVEVVHIAAPSSLHHDLAVAAALKGCHVLIEKPLALTVAEAQNVIDACQRAGVKLCVGHVERFNPAITSLMCIVKTEELIAADFRRMSPFYSRITDTSVVMDLMIHDIDILNMIFDEPIKHIHAHGACISTDKIDYAQALITFESGRLASLTASRVTESKIRKANISARNAFIDVDYLARTVEVYRKTQFDLDVGYPVQYTQENIIERVFVPIEEPLRAEFEHFAQAIQHDTPIGPCGIMGKRALEVCQHIEELIIGTGGGS